MFRKAEVTVTSMDKKEHKKQCPMWTKGCVCKPRLSWICVYKERLDFWFVSLCFGYAYKANYISHLTQCLGLIPKHIKHK